MKKILITENQLFEYTIFGDKKYVDALGSEYKQDIAGYDTSSHVRPKNYKPTTKISTNTIKLKEGGVIPEDNVIFWKNYFSKNPKNKKEGMFNGIISKGICTIKQALYLDSITGWDKYQENQNK